MTTLVTTCVQIILTACGFVFCWAAYSRSDEAHGWFLKAEAQAIKLRSERDRVTVLERELDALRRELRKLSGRFYAAQRDVPDEPAEPISEGFQQSCDNWHTAQIDGPRSEAAKCECGYCTMRRAERRALRAALVPRTVQGQADLARLNAGKP